MTPKRKAKASPKKKSSSPLPDDSPTSGNRLYAFKGVGKVRVLPGEKVKLGVRTPRRYQVVNRKRPAGFDRQKLSGIAGEYQPSSRTRRRHNAKANAESDQESDAKVFDKDEDPKLDTDSD